MWLMATSAGSAIGWWFRLCTTTANTEFVCTDNFRATSAVSLMSPLSRVPLIASWSWTTLALVALIFFSKPAGLEVLEVGDCVKLTRPNVFREFSSTKRLVHDQSEEKKPKTITELSFFFPLFFPFNDTIYVYKCRRTNAAFFTFFFFYRGLHTFPSSFLLSWLCHEQSSKNVLKRCCATEQIYAWLPESHIYPLYVACYQRSSDASLTFLMPLLWHLRRARMKTNFGKETLLAHLKRSWWYLLVALWRVAFLLILHPVFFLCALVAFHCSLFVSFLSFSHLNIVQSS